MRVHQKKNVSGDKFNRMLILVLHNFDEPGQAVQTLPSEKNNIFCTCILFVIIFPNSRYAYPAKEKIRNLIGRSSRDLSKLASSWNSPRTIEKLAGN